MQTENVTVAGEQGGRDVLPTAWCYDGSASCHSEPRPAGPLLQWYRGGVLGVQSLSLGGRAAD